MIKPFPQSEDHLRIQKRLSEDATQLHGIHFVHYTYARINKTQWDSLLSYLRILSLLLAIARRET